MVVYRGGFLQEEIGTKRAKESRGREYEKQKERVLERGVRPKRK